jgi:ABC-type spermidine/putrescine transport system permease subunit I
MKFAAKQRQSWGMYATVLPPVIWMGLLYFLPIAILASYSFWRLEGFEIIQEFSFTNFQAIATNTSYQSVIFRTLATALGVTILDMIIALPVGYFIGRYTGKYQTIFTLLVILPLWSSYLVRVFAWKVILGYNGVLNNLLIFLGVFDRPSQIFLYNQFSTTLTFVHVWLPFMILPIITAFEKLPPELLEASADLNAKPLTTFFRVALPQVIPGVWAGAISVFSLTMGDFITPSLVGGTNGIMLGNLIASQFGIAYNWPLGAAFSLLVIILVFTALTFAMKQGALDN